MARTKRKFRQSQYDMLKRCSDSKDMTEWNQWRENNREEDVLLEKAFLAKFYLRGVMFNRFETRDEKDTFWNVKGRWEGWLNEVHLEGSDLHMADLKDAYLEYANLEGAILDGANLQNADLWQTHLEGVDFGHAKLQGTWLNLTTVSSSTILWKPEINKYHKDKRFTDFSDVGLHNVRIDPGTKQLLEYNIRRKNWGEWYKNHRFLKWPVSGFWRLSDYGLSTWQVIKAFLVFAVVFAVLYYSWGAVDHYLLKINDRPGLVSNLFVLESGDPVSWCEVPIRALYFSVVTMTTLGFGDMYANVAIFSDNPYANLRSGWGHFLLMIQVILGYIMLGALVTRFAVLFTAGGPAGEFTEMDDETKKQTST